jgi:hypothetical protein
MKFVTKFAYTILLSCLAAVPIAWQLDKPAVAQADTPSQTPTAQQAEQPVTYSYVAQPGDSYSHIARKAIQTYGKKTNTNISQAAIIFAETNLTLAAGSPGLVINQKVNIVESVVKQWVEKAKNLTPAQQAAWQYYVQFVDFKTDRVGQAL